MNLHLTPPRQVPSVLIRAKEAYRLWHKYLVNLNRLDRYTVGAKIDEIFLSFLELIFRASFANGKLEKYSILSQAISKCDLLNFFLQLAWEQKVIDHKNYSSLILFLDETGRMLGGWKKSLQEKTPK